MIHLVICNAEGCPNSGIEYRMVDPAPTITCGGCGDYLEAVVTEESADE